MNKLEPELADSPHGIRSSAGKLIRGFGWCYGSSYSVLPILNLPVNELVNFKIKAVRGLEGIKETKVKIGDLELGVAVASGLANAKKLIEEIQEMAKTTFILSK